MQPETAPKALPADNVIKSISQDYKQVKEIADSMNKVTESLNHKLKFKVDKEAGNRIIVKVVDKDTDEVIRQIPPEEYLKMVARMHEFIGMVFDKKA